MTHEVAVDVNDTIEATDDNPHEPPAIDLACSLDDDADTSLATSVRLHLLSEHQLAGALQLPDAEAVTRHGDLHLGHPQDHRVNDLRFRPGRALSSLLLNLARCEQLIRQLVPAQPTRV